MYTQFKTLKSYFILLLILQSKFNYIYAQKVEWISSTSNYSWRIESLKLSKIKKTKVEATVNSENEQQQIDGFGACFNELGWTSLNSLNDIEKRSIFKELFTSTGANFTICRMPIAANDFARKWYSYDETDGDFAMKNFSINNDQETLIPFIKSALNENPELKLWASPWSPPVWMKSNKHYAGAANHSSNTAPSGVPETILPKLDNGLRTGQEGKEGTNMFIQDERYFKAYALYFAKFIQAYRKQNINIGMVMPQNEFNSAQPFPSCTWTAAGLSKFVSFLGPEMNKLGVDIFMGTVERGNPKLVDTVLTNSYSAPYIKGAGFQWAGKDAIAAIHQRYPKLTLYQSEQECGDGLNDWKYCKYTWSLIKHYLNNGANAYMYWNISLQNGGESVWGWKQNSLITVDTIAKTYKYNYEYYLIKHLSHYVKPGAKKLQVTGNNDVLAFENSDKSKIIIVYNEANVAKTWRIKVGRKMLAPQLAADSFNTFFIKN